MNKNNVLNEIRKLNNNDINLIIRSMKELSKKAPLWLLEQLVMDNYYRLQECDITTPKQVLEEYGYNNILIYDKSGNELINGSNKEELKEYWEKYVQVDVFYQDSNGYTCLKCNLVTQV